MFRSFLLTAIGLCCCFGASADAGVMSPGFQGEIRVPRLRASFDEVSGELELNGIAFTVPRRGNTSVYSFQLDANFDSSGVFNSNQKGAFSITDGSVVLLKGTITEATSTTFGTRGQMRFRATQDIAGKWSQYYSGAIELNVRLTGAPALTALSFEPGFTASGEAAVTRSVPEPASLTMLAAVGLLGLGAGKRRRNRSAAA